MKDKVLEEAGKLIGKLYFVQWDRYVDCWNQGKVFRFYGWIERVNDMYKDFIVLEYSGGDFNYTTSSNLWSEKIGKILGFEDDEVKCQRMEDIFPEHVNVIRLEKLHKTPRF